MEDHLAGYISEETYPTEEENITADSKVSFSAFLFSIIQWHMHMIPSTHQLAKNIENVQRETSFSDDIKGRGASFLDRVE